MDKILWTSFSMKQYSAAIAQTTMQVNQQLEDLNISLLGESHKLDDNVRWPSVIRSLTTVIMMLGTWVKTLFLFVIAVNSQLRRRTTGQHYLYFDSAGQSTVSLNILPSDIMMSRRMFCPQVLKSQTRYHRFITVAWCELLANISWCICLLISTKTRSVMNLVLVSTSRRSRNNPPWLTLRGKGECCAGLQGPRWSPQANSHSI